MEAYQENKESEGARIRISSPESRYSSRERLPELLNMVEQFAQEILDRVERR